MIGLLTGLALVASSIPVWKVSEHSDPITDDRWVSLKTDQGGNLLVIKCSATKNPWSTTIVTEQYIGGHPMIRGAVFRVDSSPPVTTSFFADGYSSLDVGSGTRESKLLTAKASIAFRINLGKEGYGTADAVFDARSLPIKAKDFQSKCRVIGAPILR
jgi:hypothetical protein